MSWNTIKLGDYIETLTDYHANGAYKKLKANVELKYKPDYALMIRTLNFEQHNFISNLIWVNETEYNFLSKSKVYPNDIIMNKIANAGSVYIMPNLYRPVSLAMNLFLIRFRELNQRFMYYLMKTNEPYIKSFANGVATQSITKDAVRNLEFDIPSKIAQKRIADILSAYDDLIENNLKRIKLLEQAAQNIYKEWFVNMRFPGHENTPVNNETGLPEGWEYGIVSNLCKVKSGYAFKSKHWRKEGNPVIKIKNINNNTVNIGNSDFVDDEVADIANKYELFAGDVLIAMTGATVGKVGLIPKFDKRIYLNQRVGLFRPLSEENNNIALVFSFFLTDDSQQQVLNFAQGAAQPNISGSEIGNIKLNIADSKVLLQFNKLVKPSINLIQTLYGQNQKLKVARDILLPRLMNRTIEV
jgi:type I restriction enzyme, S subunit